jgi:hypothetical protein
VRILAEKISDGQCLDMCRAIALDLKPNAEAWRRRGNAEKRKIQARYRQEFDFLCVISASSAPLR